MLSKEKYERLNKKIIIDKSLIPDYEEIIQYYNEMNDISKNTVNIQDNDENLLNIAELYSMYFGIMSLSIVSNKEDSNYREKLLYSSIFSTIANSTISVIYLAQKGLDYQANVITRQLFEMCMLLLNVSLDKNKQNILMETEMTEQNMKIWRKYFSPKELNDTIQKYEGKSLTNWRKKQYSSYSNYSHNEFLSFFCFSFACPKNDRDNLVSNLWGGYASRVNTILENMINFLWYTSKAFMKIIIDKNTHISKEILGTDQEFWDFCGYIFLLLDEYYSEYLESNLCS